MARTLNLSGLIFRIARYELIYIVNLTNYKMPQILGLTFYANSL